MRRTARSKSRLVVGLMSGTSADGIDAVVAEVIDGDGNLQAKVLAHDHRAFAAPLRNRILKACLHGHVAELCELNFILGEQFARAALRVIRKARLRTKDIFVIGSHGQTVHHLPNAKTPSTLQIGEPSIIAERTGVTTVADFRVRDMAAGGQGAPLVPFLDYALFRDRTRPRILQNLGGIGNLTLLPRAAKPQDVLAFDTGPGNMVMDAIVSRLTDGKAGYDEDGKLAAAGRVSETLVRESMKHPFLRKAPPKTTGREEFGEPFVNDFLERAKRLKVAGRDLVATATAFTAETVADAYRRFAFPRLKKSDLPKLQIILGGGGGKNPTLKKMLRERIGVGELLTVEDFGIDNEAKEALAFAVMAYETMLGRPSNVPSATGAKRAVVLGKIVPA
jgi:anhydro-N-acetylmuramic acid kinase